MFYQDPLLSFYQQPPLLHNSVNLPPSMNLLPRNPPPRPSFFIDNLLIPHGVSSPRSQSFLGSKQSSFQEHSPSTTSSSSLKFGMHSILSSQPGDRDESLTQPPSALLYQGTETTTYYPRSRYPSICKFLTICVNLSSAYLTLLVTSQCNQCILFYKTLLYLFIIESFSQFSQCETVF